VTGVKVETFEYVRVGDTALTRAGGVLPPGGSRPSDFTLEVSVLGEGSEALRALVEGAPGRDESWRAAFATRLELVEHPAAEFALLTDDGRIALDPPLLRELHSKAAPGDELGELESRVREAEAGLDWIQEQLSRERERRRALEEEVETLLAERDATAPERVAELERQIEELRVLEDEVTRLAAELEGSRKVAAEWEARHAEVRYELGLVRGASDATIAQLESALESARALGEVARAEPGKRPRPEPAVGAAVCTECGASGECPGCGGKGRRRGMRCRDCGGSGGCAACDGTGYLWDEGT